jgi:hypothetical protein
MWRPMGKGAGDAGVSCAAEAETAADRRRAFK